MRYARRGPVRFLSHLDLIRAVERAVRRTSLQTAFTEGFHPRLRLAFASALPVGAESEAEWLDLDLRAESPASAADVMAALNAALPPGLEVLAAREVIFPCKNLGGIIGLSVWRLEGPVYDAAQAERRWRDLPAEGPWNVIRRSQRRDVRPLIERLEFHPDHMTLGARIVQTGSVKPDEVLTLLGYDESERQTFRATRQALLAPAANGSGWTEPWGETVL